MICGVVGSCGLPWIKHLAAADCSATDQPDLILVTTGMSADVVVDFENVVVVVLEFEVFFAVVDDVGELAFVELAVIIVLVVFMTVVV